MIRDDVLVGFARVQQNLRPWRLASLFSVPIVLFFIFRLYSLWFSYVAFMRHPAAPAARVIARREFLTSLLWIGAGFLPLVGIFVGWAWYVAATTAPRCPRCSHLLLPGVRKRLLSSGQCPYCHEQLFQPSAPQA